MKKLSSASILLGSLSFLFASQSMYAGITFTNIFSFNGTNGARPFFLVQAGNNKFFGTTQTGGPNFTDPGNENLGGIFSITSDGVLSNLFFFEGTNGSSGSYLTPGTDGNFYGTTSGTVFELNADGSMANPNLAPELGDYDPYGILQDHDGTLYGLTVGGGSSGYGTAYKIDTNGGFSTFVNFNRTNAWPVALLLAADNNFYGVTESGGINDEGTIFRIDRSGNLTSIFLFGGTNGAAPYWLLQGTDGDLYGITSSGGSYNVGTIFRLTTNGTLVWSFSLNGTNGSNPFWLMPANDGNFYGMTAWGGNNYNGGNTGFGTIFRITPNDSFASLVQFDGTNDTCTVTPATMVQGTDGNLYGTSSGGGTYGQGAIFKLTLPTCPPTNRLMLTSLYNFYDNGMLDFPEGGLIQASDGMLYGITQNGGAFEGGTVFRTTLSGSLTTLVTFNGTNGAIPTAPPVQAADGKFYGTTARGGSDFIPDSASYGTIYRMDSNGVLTTLFSFNQTNGAGAGGISGLVVGNDGAFYGVTQGGGPDFTNVYGGDGTIFKITTNGDFTLLASFNGTNGSEPACLIQASDGNFYGTTVAGGTNAWGTVFRMTADGRINTLVEFNGANGGGPTGLMQASDGCLYGTTAEGGAFYSANQGYGTVFKVTTNGDFTLLASFSLTNGASPRGAMTEVCNGLFYGTAYAGGLYTYVGGPPAGGGTIFQFRTNGDLTALVPFGANPLFPSMPLGRLLKASDGNYYGTSQNGGTTNSDSSAGGIFAIRPVQPPVLQPLAQPGQLNLNWNAWAGYSYAVMYETNLAGSNWNLLSTVTPQTNGMTSFTDSIGPDVQRFYSVVLQLP